MKNNRGSSTLKQRRRSGNPMAEYDNLPKELRSWLSCASLPWRARSVKIAYDKAYKRTGDRDQALEELDRLQDRLISKDALKIWGQDHPNAAGATAGQC